MTDDEILLAYESYYASIGACEPGPPLCACGSPTNGLEAGQEEVCHDCWLASLPTCSECGDTPGTEYVGERYSLCANCDRRYNAEPEDEEPDELLGDDGHDLGNPVGKVGAA